VIQDNSGCFRANPDPNSWINERNKKPDAFRLHWKPTNLQIGHSENQNFLLILVFLWGLLVLDPEKYNPCEWGSMQILTQIFAARWRRTIRICLSKSSACKFFCWLMLILFQDWCRYWEAEPRKEILNGISLEFSLTKLDPQVTPPQIVRQVIKKTTTTYWKAWDWSVLPTATVLDFVSFWQINYLCTYDLYGPVRNVFDAGRCITWGSVPQWNCTSR
jgi:hypothetical protein